MIAKDLRECAIEAIRNGATLHAAAEIADVHHMTVYGWCRAAGVRPSKRRRALLGHDAFRAQQEALHPGMIGAIETLGSARCECCNAVSTYDSIAFQYGLSKQRIHQIAQRLRRGVALGVTPGAR